MEQTSPLLDLEPEGPAESPAPPAPPPARKRWLGRLLGFSLVACILGTGGGVIGIAALSSDLPEIRSLADYQPHQASVVFGSEGQVAARFAKERRTVVPMDRIAEVMVNAVIAAEDSDFFRHRGLDYSGIVRCAVKNLFSGRKACGASTITQQTVKTFFLTPKKTYTRKLREMILAKRLEEALEKRDILYLYLNQIYFGHGAHGVEEASRVYFGKSALDLSVEEAALLAGLPQSPNRLDPYRHPDRALARREYVLGRLLALRMIDEKIHAAALAKPLKLDHRSAESDLDSNSHYAAHVRTELEALFGEERVLSGGLKVYTGLDPVLQRSGELAVENGLRELDKRQGWRGPIRHLDPDEARAVLLKLEERRRLASSAADDPASPVVWNLARLEKAPDAPVEELPEHARFPALELGSIYGGLVTEVSAASKEAKVDLGGAEIVLPLRTAMSWARKFDVTRATKRPSDPGEVLAPGDVVLVRPTVAKKNATTKRPVYIGELEQAPRVQGALVSIDPATREVRALIGGLGVGAGRFNRATQARRQAGSTFKPVVYAAAFEGLGFTPVSRCLDAPRVYRDPWTGRAWKPENYGGGFDGDMSLRRALTLSKNMCSVELIDRVGVEPVLEMAVRLGIESPLPRNLTLALGSGDVTPLEMVNAFATIAAGGVFHEAIFVKKVVDPSGELLYLAKSEPREALRPEIAYQITSMLQSVVEDGTAMRVKRLNRPVAGKTGTTNESRNAWFIGYTPDLVSGVWVGFDNNDPLGPNETGGRAAIPVWLEHTERALAGRAPEDFIAPTGIVFALVDPVSGKLASPDMEGAASEPFVGGTEPTEIAPANTSPLDRGIWEDYE